MSVVNLFPNLDVFEGLKNIADLAKAGEFPADTCTIILGTDVFHLGCASDSQAATDAIFNMTLGIHKLMKPIFDDG